MFANKSYMYSTKISDEDEVSIKIMQKIICKCCTL